MLLMASAYRHDQDDATPANTGFIPLPARFAIYPLKRTRRVVFNRMPASARQAHCGQQMYERTADRWEANSVG